MLRQWLRAAGITLTLPLVLAAWGAALGPSPTGGHPAPQPSAEVQVLLQQADQAEKPAAKLQFSEDALAKARSLSDQPGEAAALHRIGIAYWFAGEPQKALDFDNQALPLMRATGDQRGEAATLNDVGLVYSHLGQPQQALVFYNQLPRA